MRRGYAENSPLMEGILPAEAAEGLGRCQAQYEEHRRKQKAFDMGEDLRGLLHQQCPRLEFTRRQLRSRRALRSGDSLTRRGSVPLSGADAAHEVIRMQEEKRAGCKRVPAAREQWRTYHEVSRPCRGEAQGHQ